MMIVVEALDEGGHVATLRCRFCGIPVGINIRSRKSLQKPRVAKLIIELLCAAAAIAVILLPNRDGAWTIVGVVAMFGLGITAVMQLIDAMS